MTSIGKSLGAELLVDGQSQSPCNQFSAPFFKMDVVGKIGGCQSRDVVCRQLHTTVFFNDLAKALSVGIVVPAIAFGV